MTWVGGILNDVAGSFAQVVWKNCIEIQELHTDNPLCSFDYLYQISQVLYSAAGVPHHGICYIYIYMCVICKLACIVQFPISLIGRFFERYSVVILRTVVLLGHNCSYL